MDRFHQVTTTSAELRAAQRCRLYLKATTVSDIATIDGNSIHPRVLNGEIPDDRCSNLRYPRQQRPPASSWTLWRRLVSRALTTSPDSCRLRQPMGKWYTNVQQNCRWKWLYSKDTRKCYSAQTINSNTTIYECQTLRAAIHLLRHRGTTLNPVSATTNTLPPDAIPCEITNNRLTRVPTPTNTPSPQNMNILTAAQVYEGIEEDSEILPDELSRQINQSKVTIYLAASKANGKAVAAWRIQTQNFVINGHRSHESNSQTSLNRLCLKALVGATSWIIRKLESDKSPLQPISVFCRQQGLATKLRPWPSKSLANDFSIISFLQTSRVSFNFIVPSRSQGNSQSPHQSTLDQMLEKAIEIRNSDQPTSHLCTLPSDIEVCLENRPIVNNLDTAIRNSVTGNNLKQFLMNEHGWTQTTFQDIDWEAHGYVLEQLPLSKQIRTIKYIHGWLPTRAHQLRFNSDADATCPCCMAHPETHIHVIQCPASRMAETNLQFLAQWKQKWDSSKAPVIPKRLTEAIILGIKQHSAQDEPTWQALPNSEQEQLIKKAFQAQTKIGWDHFLCGRVSKQWEIAGLHKWASKSPDGKGVGIRWTRQLIKRIFMLLEAMWECRNGIVHGRNKEESDSILRAKLRQQINQAYQAGTQRLLPQFHDLLHKPKEERLQGSTLSQQCWVADYNAAIRITDRQRQTVVVQADGSRQPTLHRYFSVTNQATTIPTHAETDDWADPE